MNIKESTNTIVEHSISPSQHQYNGKARASSEAVLKLTMTSTTYCGTSLITHARKTI